MPGDIADVEAVFKSVKNRKWKKFPIDESYFTNLKNNSDLSGIILELMAIRGVRVDEVHKYIAPKIKDYLPDPNHLLDMQKATEFLSTAISQGKRFAVFGDYDVDGATSSALLKKFFKKIGHDILIYIPDRIREGYGPNVEALKYLKNQEIDIVITVDCGAVAYSALQEAKKIGLEVVVIDHHIGGDNLPEAIAVVNPNRQDETSGYGYLCAAGVTFLMLISLNSKLKEKEQKHLSSKDLLEMLDLVALGTICDVVPVKGLNRAFVSQGIKLISQASNVGIKALKQISGIDGEVDAYHLGFLLGPRINAGGRVGDASLGAKLLSSNDFNESMEMSRALDMHNHERKAIEMKLVEDSIKTAASTQGDKPVLFIVGKGWHLGVIGIIAGRLKEKFNKPAIVISLNDDEGKASCRSVKGIDIGSLIHYAKEQGILEVGGGHAMAAGFTVKTDKIEELKEFFYKEVKVDYQKFTEQDFDYFDCEISPAVVDVDFVRDIDRVGPFGSDNPHPRFYLKNVNIINAKIVGKEHVSCLIAGASELSKKFIKAISFRSINSPLGEILLRNQKNIDVIAQLTLNKWNNRVSAEITIHDVIINS